MGQIYKFRGSSINGDSEHFTVLKEDEWDAPIFSKGIDTAGIFDWTEEDFVQPQRNALRLDGAKSHMSNRYFDWTRNCFKHMIF